MADRAFSSYTLTHGRVAECDRNFPSYLSAWNDGKLELAPGDTHYGYVQEGSIILHIGRHVFPVFEGQAFCAPGSALVDGEKSKGIVVSRENWLGVPIIYGPVEWEGRLKYIDGCTDSLLIPPPKLGDPCLNLLYFPPGIDQTRHTHPSDRIGIVMSGRGRCHYWDDGQTEQTIDLTAGMIWRIHAEGHHKFSTPYGEDMRVLAFHPDSDFGPTDEFHPMLNRTIVDGVSARFIDEIRTK